MPVAATSATNSAPDFGYFVAGSGLPGSSSAADSATVAAVGETDSGSDFARDCAAEFALGSVACSASRLESTPAPGSD